MSAAASRPRVFGMRIDADRLLPPERYPFGEGRAERLEALGRALAASPIWNAEDRAVIAVRSEVPTGLAVMGYLTETTAARLGSLGEQLESLLPRFRYVSYGQAEEDCERLADRLVDRFGIEDVRRMTYLAIPRGGFVVLGILAYVLGLRRDRLLQGAGSGRGADGSPLVVVDDCSITGLRFGEIVRTHSGRDLVFAHLYSHPELRAAIRTREPRVVAALSARDLGDAAPEAMGAGYAEWRERWSERTGGRVYWLGRPEHLCFPWSEPDFTVWNEAEEREEPGWRIAPPEACLKNRYEFMGRRPAVQVQDRSTAAVPLATGSFHAKLEGDVILANVDTGKAVRLGGVAGELWTALLRNGRPASAADALANDYDIEAARIAADARTLLDDLRERGFLEQSTSEREESRR